MGGVAAAAEVRWSVLRLCSLRAGLWGTSGSAVAARAEETAVSALGHGLARPRGAQRSPAPPVHVRRLPPGPGGLSPLRAFIRGRRSPDGASPGPPRQPPPARSPASPSPGAGLSLETAVPAAAVCDEARGAFCAVSAPRPRLVRPPEGNPGLRASRAPGLAVGP
ncbi:hypothetical protein NN561_011734 [Cricetulus griseus]